MMSEPFGHDHPHDRNASDARPAGLLHLLAFSALLLASWQCVSARHHRRRHGRSAPKPERLQTWENEGGRPDPLHEPLATTAAVAATSTRG